MKTRALVAILGGLLVAGAAAPQPSVPVPKDPAVTEGDLGARRPALETPWFTFYSHFGFNLYDAVMTSAHELRAKRPDPAVEGACFAGLVGEERGAWNAAVGYFADTLAATSDFSRERAIVRAELVGVEIPGGLDDDDRRDLALSLLFLRAAAPAYRACRWPEQDIVNRRWIAELEPRLARHADQIAARLQPLFGVQWRSRPLWVDVVATAGWAA